MTAEKVTLTGIDSRSVPRLALKARFRSAGTATPLLDNWTVTFGIPPLVPPSVLDLYLPWILIGGFGGGGAGTIVLVAYLTSRPARLPPVR